MQKKSKLEHRLPTCFIKIRFVEIRIYVHKQYSALSCIVSKNNKRKHLLKENRWL